jgi:hypothetical protein
MIEVTDTTPEELEKGRVQIVTPLSTQKMIFKPKMLGEYWFINSRGKASLNIWVDSKGDRERLSIGNGYPTKEAAERIISNRKTLTKLREFAFEPNWSDKNQEKHFFDMGYYGLNGSIATNFNYGSPVHFATNELRMQALEAVGDYSAINELLIYGVL